MESPSRAQPDVAALVDSMFGEVLAAEERAGLLAWIHAWEAENPDVTDAERVTGWIDVAYAFQERGASLPSWWPPEAPTVTGEAPSA